MAKNQNEATETEAGEATATADSRLIMIDVPEGHASGLSGRQPRNAVIRALAETGDWTRGDIAKEITTLQYPDGSKKVPYQIVFQATKNIQGIKMAQRGGDAAAAEGEGEAAVASE